MAFKLYILYIVSFLLHIPARLPVLGVLRIDFLLGLVVLGFVLFQGKKQSSRGRPDKPVDSGVSKILYVLFAYILLTLPFVEYPGSVLKNNFVVFLKCTFFFFFTVALVDTRKKLQILVVVLLVCQVIRVLEPLYLNATTGYWGSETYVGDGEMAARLAGGPHDVINSNGLAAVILIILPLLHYLTVRTRRLKYVYWILLPLMLVALVKSLSRSGMIGFAIVYAGIFVRSKRKLLILTLALIGSLVTIANLTDVQRDRYLSIFSSDTKQGATAHGRITGLLVDFNVALQRPIFGFGLGTSAEAKYHILGNAQLAHDLYLEVAQELGFVGLIIYLVFLKRIIANFILIRKRIAESSRDDDYILRLVDGLQVWMLMNLLFSLASYGLSDWTWYFFAGLSSAVLNVVDGEQRQAAVTEVVPNRLGAGGRDARQ